MTMLRVIADDLTGSCDVGAEFLPWTDGVVVQPTTDAPPSCGIGERALWVRNSQSRTLAPGHAAGRVAATLADVPRPWGGILFKKIDTGLRGQLGAEIDAALDALGAAEAFVLPAIPEVGRTTEGGRQMIGGVPVDRTPFAHDPHNPVTESDVARAIETTSGRRAGSVPLAAIRDPDRLGDTIDRVRREGASILVCDAQTEDDLSQAVRVILERPRPLVVVGSTGLARTFRRLLSVSVRPRAAQGPRPLRAGAGILAVVGSMYPATYGQLEHASGAGLLRVIEVTEDVDAVGAAAARIVHDGGAVALVTPRTRTPAAAGCLRAAALSALARSCPAGLVLVGGETASDVLEGLGQPPLWISGRLCPLVVHGHLLAGPYGGLPVVTKGGSSGAPDLLGQIVRKLGRAGR